MIGVTLILEKNPDYTAAIILFSIAILSFLWFISHYKKLITTIKENIRVKAKIDKVVILPDRPRPGRIHRSIMLYYSFMYEDKEVVSHAGIQAEKENIGSFHDKEIVVLVNSKKPSFTFPLFWYEKILDMNNSVNSLFGGNKN